MGLYIRKLDKITKEINMSITKKLNCISFEFNKKVRSTLVRYSESKNISKKKSLIEKVVLSKEQEQEILSFYKQYYGKSISFDWHRLYQSYTGRFNKDYFPEYIFSTQLEPLMNPYPIAEFLGDKNLIPILFRGIESLHIPTTYISCVNGILQNGDGDILNQESAIGLLNNIGKCVVKKTIETNSGRDVRVCEFVDGKDKNTQRTILDIISDFDENYVVQEFIVQHESLSCLCASAVNTFRVITYICNDNINVCPVSLRLGRNGADKDNMHYGGISIGVKDDMTLKEKAYSEYGDAYTCHPDTHVLLSNRKIGGVTL